MLNKQKTKVAVVLTKTIYLSKGALNKNNISGDAIYLAEKDFFDELTEKDSQIGVLSQKGLTMLTSIFDVKVVDSPKYVIPNNKEKKHSYSSYANLNDKTIRLGDALRLIVNYNLEKKYGFLDYEKNPRIFNLIPAIKDGEKILVPEHYTLIPKVEQEFYNLRDEYSHIFNKPESGINNVELVTPTIGEFLEEQEVYDEEEDYNEDDGF